MENFSVFACAIIGGGIISGLLLVIADAIRSFAARRISFAARLAMCSPKLDGKNFEFRSVIRSTRGFPLAYIVSFWDNTAKAVNEALFVGCDLVCPPCFRIYNVVFSSAKKSTKLAFVIQEASPLPNIAADNFYVSVAHEPGNYERFGPYWGVDYGPIFSPDGERVAFVAIDPKLDPVGQYHYYYTVVIDGSEVSKDIASQPKISFEAPHRLVVVYGREKIRT